MNVEAMEGTLSDDQRVQVVAIVCRLISELAGGKKSINGEVSEIMAHVAKTCAPRDAKALHEAFKLVSVYDFEFTVSRNGGLFTFETRFFNS